MTGEQRKGILAKLLRIPASARWGVGILLLILIILWSIPSRGEELVFSGGSTIVRGYAPVLGLDIRFPEAGPVRTDYELGLRLIGESDYKGETQSNQVVLHATLVDGYKCFRAGLGLAYLSNEDAYNGGNINFRLMAGCSFERIRLFYEHFSCAGSCTPNLGRDQLMIGWRF